MPALNEQPTVVPSFGDHFESATRELRAALIDLLASAGADSTRPQEIARQFGLNKNLTWKLSKIVHSSDPFTWAPHVPGRTGMRIALDALTSAKNKGIRPVVERSFNEFEAMVLAHAGDRTTLELMLGSLRPELVPEERRETSRKLSFQGNSATWGVHARLRFSLMMDMPNRDDADMIDAVSVGGILGFRRLRPTGSWPLARVGGHGGTNGVEGHWEPIDKPSFEADRVPLMRSFCSPNLPAIETVPIAEGNMFEIGSGPVGKAAAVSCVFGSIKRRFAPIYARGQAGDVSDHYLPFDGPLERGFFDLLVHKDLPVDLPPVASLYSRMQGRLVFPLSLEKRFHLPLTAEVQDLGSCPPQMATPHIANYGQIVQQACAAAGRKLDEFRGYRIEITYPPIPTVLVMQYPLAQRSQ